MPTQSTETLIEEAVQEFDEYNANSGGLLYPNRNSEWLRQKLNTIATKSAEESYKKALDDMFLEVCKLAELDERQPGAGNLNTNMDDIHEIRVRLSQKEEYETSK